MMHKSITCKKVKIIMTMSIWTKKWSTRMMKSWWNFPKDRVDLERFIWCMKRYGFKSLIVSFYCRNAHCVHGSQCLRSVTDMYKATGLYSCPRCKDLYDRTRSPLPEEEFPDEKYWCKGVVDEYPEGFVGTPKLNCLVEWIQRVPKSEKCIVVSFFKGSLDLLEGILWHDLQTPSARFDGDLSPSEKSDELKRFRTDPACRILLMTVQSGGVGLNSKFFLSLSCGQNH